MSSPIELSGSATRDSFDLQDDESFTLSDSESFQQGYSKLSFLYTHPLLSKPWAAYHAYLQPNVGLVLIVVSQFFNSIMAVTCKLLEADPMFETPIHPLQILFVRMAITYAFCLVYMYIDKTPHAPWGPTGYKKFLALRGFTGFFGVFGLYYSLQYMTLSDSVVITFLVPTVATFLAWLILGERYSIVESVCGLFSFGGVLLVARPSFIFGNSLSLADSSVETTDPQLRLFATGVGLLGVCGASSVLIVIRFIGKRAHPLISVSYFALTCVVISFVTLTVHPSLSFTVPQTGHQWFLFILIGVTGFVMQFCLTAGIQREKAGRSSLMLYTQMIYAVFWELIIWHRIPGFLSWVGFSIILACAVCVIMFKPQEEEVRAVPNDVEYSAGTGNNLGSTTAGNSVTDIQLSTFGKPQNQL
ncbi:hypothetical protein BABINDRAFT_162431 [Babjeviella inositovora NRRL Y-12698]|uniref:EamA domain-containing protein n=1 Tax=Babjeviella inositovora NRRL Y-12698 TaxID=984486 RepID=A0A1E3QM35_9ASCO|nr:uncharacterized protein BABINDRAFT_162431 [Babjeviella inositovora NRRL Y-12698]ODQ78741.1 hypothetical protein BABINDRAFT_162431 [Babjeviella inositovora NRRL Y-12698]